MLFLLFDESKHVKTASEHPPTVSIAGNIFIIRIYSENGFEIKQLKVTKDGRKTTGDVGWRVEFHELIQ